MKYAYYFCGWILVVALPGVAHSASNTTSSETSVFDDESIYVVQRRTFSKKHALEIAPIGFSSINNKFVGHYGPALSLAWHARENFAIEWMIAKTFARYSTIVYEVFEYEQLTPEAVDLKQLTFFSTLGVHYSAFYGKLDFSVPVLRHVLMDYDVYASTGFGLAGTREPCTPRRGDCGAPIEGLGFGLHDPADTLDRYKISGTVGLGLRMFFSNYVGLRLELRDMMYADRSIEPGLVTTDIRHNVFFMAGVSVMLGADRSGDNSGSQP